MNTQNPMTSSYHSKIRSTQNKGVTFLFCLRYGLQCNFLKQARNQKFFKAGEVSWNQGTSINISSKIHERKALLRKISNEKFNPKIHTIRTFFTKLEHFFRFSKRTGEELCVSHWFSYTLFTKTLLLFCISLSKRFICRRVNTSQIFLGATTPVTLNKNQIKVISIHFIRKNCPSSKVIYCLATKKTNHKKNHAYLTDSQYFTCLLKERYPLQHMLQSGHLQACKCLAFFY